MKGQLIIRTLRLHCYLKDDQLNKVRLQVNGVRTK